MSSKHAKLPNVWANKIARFFMDSSAITTVEFKKMFREPAELFTRAIQPILWLVIFGQVFSQANILPTGSISYLAFLTPGILAQSILFSAIFFGIAVIWERDLGIVHKLLVSPANRGALVLGKALSAGFRGFIQAIIVYIVAALLGVKMNFAFFAILGVFGSVIIGSALFSTFSLIIACVVKTRERFMGIGQLITMPLFFASNAIYPLSMMPQWLRVIAAMNPLTYLVDLLRYLMIPGADLAHHALLDVAVLVFVFILLLIIAARMYPRLVQ